MDVLDARAGKQDLLSLVLKQTQGTVIAIGDQGQPGGNDFELLAAIRSTLSVDRCSGDPTRCWNLDNRGERGPSLLVRYLRSLRPGRGGIRFTWRGY